MMSTLQSHSPSTATHAPHPAAGVQKVVVVNSSPEILSLAERALAAGHYDVVFVESLEHAYSQIRRVQPNLVVLSLRMGDRGALQVLSMLKLDPETRRIPVLTFAAEESDEQDETDDESSDNRFLATWSPSLMN